MNKIHTKECQICGYDCSGEALETPCKNCNQHSFKLGFNLSLEMGPGSEVSFPIYSSDPYNTKIQTVGNTNLHTEEESEIYEFEDFSTIKLKNRLNWARVKMCTDKTRLDVLFGSNKGSEKVHYTYKPEPRVHYFREGANLKRLFLFEGKEKKFRPVEDVIYDQKTNGKLHIKYEIRNSKIKILNTKLT